ncbi:hypothetical protein PRIPAC_91353 [Pristionchus pacificus]|uniref:IU_nuc_hydro domain-containing protein n=1 Tax=Pristionchus pacificus TaxID=54126 RepID=A0A2A6B3Y7_PRIPA|nr:hypothetical protein PRIPAC_91353 [Pristionchus pacificus]|eukprot:PDM60584.1 hypothetical protein PRIPAC_53562 [Pristionchus pacificus]
MMVRYGAIRYWLVLTVLVSGSEAVIGTRMLPKIKMIIDTDGVADDIRAISMAIQHPDVEVLGITTTHGCVSTEQAAANVARALRATGMEVLQSDFYCWEPEPAAQALIRLAREHSNVTIVVIGPLTNLALSLKLDDEFKRRPERVIIMGGNYYGTGNVHSRTSGEYNFYSDPEAASIVLSEFECPITIVPWELMLYGKDLQKPRYSTINLSRYSHINSKDATGETWQAWMQYAYCDEIAVAAAIDPDGVIKESKQLRVAVELAGTFTRGQVMVDWIDQIWDEDPTNERGVDKSRPRITFITAYDVHIVDGMMKQAVLRRREE